MDFFRILLEGHEARLDLPGRASTKRFLLGYNLPTITRRNVSIHDRPAPFGTWLALMPNQQVLEHGVDAFALPMAQLSVFVKGHVPGPANFSSLAEDLGRVVPQSLELFAHGFIGCF